VLSQKKVDKNDMDETIEESRELRRKLIDTQTNLAVVRSEMEKLRSEYEIKCEEFNNTYVTCFDYTIFVNQFTIINNKHEHKYYYRIQVNIDPLEEQSGAQYTIKRLMDDIGNCRNFNINYLTTFYNFTRCNALFCFVIFQTVDDLLL